MATATDVGARSPQGLFDDVSKYLSPPDVEAIRRAYTFAADAHAPQRRESGEPYINHPLAVAETLASIHMDTATIVAALCHDVSEDCNVPMTELESRFGREVARLVDGVTKLDKMQFLHVEGDGELPKLNGQDLWAENMRKMFLAMAEDIRVVLIKLADRLHNMRTLQFRPPAKRRRVAQETMDIYAPLANRLGIWELKWQLEDLSFRYLEPDKYHEIADKVASRRAAREKYIQRVIEVLRAELDKHELQADLSGRPKHIYSIYRKMQRRGVDVDQIYDQLAVRVLVQTIPDCYTTLGVIHSIWRPLPGQFDDYIANPKESLYQSLHTTVLAVDGRPLEIQIRTHEMHQVAEYGVAAHWRYKEGLRQDQKFDAKVAWLRQLMDWQKDVAGGAQEFVDSLKTDIFQDQVYVFTPKGEIKELPSGATPLDFAYRIHTDVGHKCIGAKVNGRLVALDTKLRNGDIVEIITAKGSRGPSRDWLNPNLGFVHTAHAREKIRQWFRRQQREENIVRGREMVDKALKRLNVDGVKLDDLASDFKYDKVDDFLAAVGYGDINPDEIGRHVLSGAEEQRRDPAAIPQFARAAMPMGGLRVLGVGDLLTRVCRSCNPVPGDNIIGYITRGRGVTVHRVDCPSVLNEDEKDRLVSVDWSESDQHVFPVTVRLEAWDREGLVRDVTAILADEKINIIALSAVVHKDQTATVWTTVEVPRLDRLSRIMSRLESIRDVFNVVREVGSGSQSAAARG
ncbi:MAG: bifunctional (p)ppGpp synthetase/guanosine-3',5'-bis(diphosphate) 3'-pyrophosphohydrolase [Chloroflexi bacterium]|nr:bifunctional (p)ppGpp synthetase/guanosine-3',5'-bis(diphosphate) 3'-pyrophosphohydrolase [Chloroflexota bacterium]MBV9893683.1 bifunctional (p)ppGpp synthetase/guanosine-3',5'-bis(diphosphate) 3'-pyrophosphohydrolase [Chloroflexota bacterium]